MSLRSFGVMFRREWPPELLCDFAREAEASSFDELWVVEDLGYHGGFSQVAAALGATSSIQVGLGIAPAVVRNAAYLAMEVATTERLFPGRFHMGLGHGVDSWIDQVGARPDSWLRSLGEVADATRRLVAGDRLTLSGDHVRLSEVQLEHPVSGRPPQLSFGVRGPRSIELAAGHADGVILAECSGPRYVADTRSVIGSDARLTVFVNATVDRLAARAEVDRRLAQSRFAGQISVYTGLDIDLYDELTISGPIDDWADHCDRFFAAGADSVVLVPLAHDPSVLATYGEFLSLRR